MRYRTVKLLFTIYLLISDGALALYNSQGPSFLFEPPGKSEFMNTVGGRLDCSARGNPTPNVSWLLMDNSRVSTIPSVRHVLENGSLHFPPFEVEAFRQDVHWATYRCSVWNSVGTIISRDVVVRAVVKQRYDPEIQSPQIFYHGNALLRCVVPSFVRDHVAVSSWLQEPSFNIYPSSTSDGKYHMLPSGELMIINVSSEDVQKRFRCRTHHRLTEEVAVSSGYARINLAEDLGPAPPTILRKISTATVRSDEVLAIPCVASGNPPPKYKWFRRAHSKEFALNDTERLTTQDGTLVILGAREGDSGVYYCQARNSAGTDVLELIVVVTHLLTANIQPPFQTVHLEGTAELECNIHGFPRKNIAWLKDGQPLRFGPKIRKISETKILILNIAKEDKGMYQCVVKNEVIVCQSAGEIEMGGPLLWQKIAFEDLPKYIKETYPALGYKFIEQTMQPGPSVSLKCSASGNPTPQITWTLDGYPLVANERLIIGQYVTVLGDVISHVNISSVKPEDSGEYECTAENRAGSSKHAARLNVYGVPYVRNMPPIAAVAEKELVIKCPIAGYPVESVQWEKDKVRLPASFRQRIENNSLVIENVQSDSDQGSYTCTARNKQGHTSHGTVQVSVVIPPKITPFSFPRDLKLGDRISVQCLVVSGDEPLWFSWLKNGETPSEQDGVNIRNIDPYTSSLSISAITPANSGNYTCRAANPVASVTHTATLNVNAPPRIAPFYFGEHLTTGMRAEVMCSSSRGDLPLNISWSKDGVPISEIAGTHVNNDRQFSSILTIFEVTPSHSGNYTCQIANAAGVERRSAALFVTVPPFWVSEPVREQNVILGSSTSLHCNADGFPKPVITWKIASGVKSRGGGSQPHADEYREVAYSTHNLLKMENGSLTILRATAQDEGFYMCSASNGVGAGKSALIRLMVHVSPSFSAKSRLEAVRKGDTARIRCEVDGDQPIEIAWRLRGVRLDTDYDLRYTIRNTSLPSGILSELTIMEVGHRDKGTYMCTATNAYGTDHTSIKLLVEEPPSFPRDLRVIKQGSRSISLNWSPPSTFSDSKVSRYRLQYKEARDEWHERSPQVTVSGDITGADIEGLKPATMYHFRIYAENLLGVSESSDVLHGITEGEAPSGAPRLINAEPVTSTQIYVTWQPPDISTWNGDLTGYKLGYKLVGISPSGKYNWTSIRVAPGAPGDYRLEGLEKFKNYSIVISATNARGEGPRSEPFTVQTKEGVPSSPPQDVQCNTLTFQGLQVSWRPPPPASAHGVILGFQVAYASSEDWYFLSSRQTKKVSLNQNTILHGLKAYTNYTIQVLAYTQAGEGARSPLITCRTDEAVPEPPAAIKAVASSKNTVIVGWQPPRSANGEILFYAVHIRTLQQIPQMKVVKIPPHVFDYKIEVREDEKSEAWVSASTRVGSGHNTNVVQLIPSSEVSARIVSFGQDMIVPWKSIVRLPCLAVGKPQLHLEWRHAGIKVQKGPRITIGPDKALSIHNIERSNGGNYSCHVHNTFSSDSINYAVIVQVPPSAPVLLATAITTETVRLQWKEADSGGSRIRGFELAFMEKGEEPRNIMLEESTAMYLVEGLKCGTEYHFSITAFNKIGPGPATNWNIQRTKGSRPIPPSKSHFLSINSSCVTLHLSTWGDGGCVLSHFSLEYRIYNEDWIKVSDHIQPLREYYLPNLLPATDYVIRVGAHNNAGTTEQQYPITTASLQGAPKAPNSATFDNDYTHADVNAYIRLALLTIALLLTVILTVAAVWYCYRKGPQLNGGGISQSQSTTTMDNKQNMAQREQYYTTLRKSPHSRYLESVQLERIPEHAEDIYPYATFQMPDRDNSHSNNSERLPYLEETQMTEFTGICGKPRNGNLSIRKKKKKSHKSDSEDYDSIGSDSDMDDCVARGFTEHDPLGHHGKRYRAHPRAPVIPHPIHHIVPIQEAESSTSTEVSPASERRRRSKSQKKRLKRNGGNKDMTESMDDKRQCTDRLSKTDEALNTMEKRLHTSRMSRYHTTNSYRHNDEKSAYFENGECVEQWRFQAQPGDFTIAV